MKASTILALIFSLSTSLTAWQPAHSTTVEEKATSVTPSYAVMAEPMVWRRLPKQEQTITALDISPTGDFVVGGSEEAIVHLWDIRAQQVVRSLHSHTAKVTSVVFSPNGRTFVSSSMDKTIKIWNLAMLRLKMTIYTDREIHSLAVSPHGQTFASGNEDGTVEIWNLNTGKKRREFSTPMHSEVDVAYSEDGRVLVTRYRDRDIVHFWNPLTGDFLGSNLAEDPWSVSDRPTDRVCENLSRWLNTHNRRQIDGFQGQLCGAIASTSKGSFLADVDPNYIVLWRFPNPLRFTANRP
ncbi:hypothetical protein PJF56_13095 [Roseofilum sp. BLCC_M91]|uniref:WD40 repeat domain-containing protein n=1 Tax=Roseofilum halophilum BLCC-M91 TaxID=3022259 RepID=A0ABT7BKS8_9CYAN|nr:hypothetical protein [Roseofilum halophilum]MDJ1179802.1 hypothetical protein [Roseofilum halophilum BLCC-M91]